MRLKTIREAAGRYDAVVVGGGLGGMTAAKRLADAGRSVLLLEAHSTLGGYAAWFRRKSHVFDVALHAFPWGVAKTFKKYWSSELGERVKPLPRIRYDNPEFSFTTTFEAEDFKRLLAGRFAIPREQADAFFAACRGMDFFNPGPDTTRDLLERHFPGRTDVARFLLETVTYATGCNLDDPAAAYAIIFSNFAQKGTCTFIGGTDLLVAEMQKLLLGAGVDIVLGTRVEKIRIEGGLVAGVTAGGRDIDSAVVASNANLKATGLELAGMDRIDPEFAAAMRAVPLSVSVAQAYIGIKPGTAIPEIADILFASSEKRYDAKAFRAFPPRSVSFSFYYPHTIRPDSETTEIVATVCADYADWAGLSREEYRDKKRLLCETALDVLSRHIPDIREKIDVLEAATPITLERFTGHWRGASFGTKFPGYAAAEELARRAPGLFHCGSQGIIMSGWLGSANCGALAAGKADAFLDKRGDRAETPC